MYSKIIMEGNTVYETDDDCMKKLKEKEKSSTEKEASAAPIQTREKKQ